MPLNDFNIKKAKPRNTVYRLRDGSAATKGFGITVAPAGTKTFFIAYTSPITGKRTQVSIGPYPAISLKEARSKAVDIRQQIASGIDPKEKIKADIHARHALTERGTVADLFSLYVSDLEMDGKRSAKEVRRIYDKHIASVIGNKFAADISSDDVLDVLTPIVRRGSLVHADNVRAYLRAAFELGIHAKTMTRWRGNIPNFDIAINPVLATKRATKRKAVGTRALSEDEVRLVWSADGLSDASRLAVKLLLATGQRVEEVLHATWDEFDLKKLIWTIPAERRKTRHEVTEPHIVPLSNFHVGLLNEIKAKVGHKKWLFPHKDGKQPRKYDALYQAVARFCKANNIESFAPRDCRRTFKTLTGSIGIDLELRNRLQGHAMTDVGSRHYDRWTYLPEKKEGMETWTTWLRRLVN